MKFGEEVVEILEAYDVTGPTGRRGSWSWCCLDSLGSAPAALPRVACGGAYSSASDR